MRSKGFGAVVCGALLLAGPSGAEDLGDAPGFRAKSVTYIEGQEPQKEVQVFMGPAGRRLEGIPPQGITLVAPSGADQRWLVDEDGGRYAVDPSKAKGGRLGGLLAHEACRGYAKAERLGEVTLNGRRTVKWECRHPGFEKTTQWFDPAINTVIRDRSAKGEIQELRAIRVGKQAPELFRFDGSEGLEQVPVIQLFQR